MNGHAGGETKEFVLLLAPRLSLRAQVLLAAADAVTRGPPQRRG
jgi:hypothetical protein